MNPPDDTVLPMSAVEHALLATAAADDGDTPAAQEHIGSARRHARSSTRRERQVVEIAALAVAGDRQRASGLALVHTAEFPDDADLLARITRAS